MELQVFENSEFGRVRTLLDADGKILFCGSDVAKALGYSQTAKAVREHCKEDGCLIQTVTDGLGRTQRARFITEGNVYRLILRSKLPSAEKFEQWVVDEVLPSIRGHGAYIAPDVLARMEQSPEFTGQLMELLKRERMKTGGPEQRMAVMMAKSGYFDKLVDTSTLTNIRQTAKELRIPEKLFTYLLVEMGFAYRTTKRLLIWLSDYVPKRLGGFVQVQEMQAPTKPDCPLIGQDGNIFGLMGIASRTLKENGLAEQAKEVRGRITASGSYDEALCIIGEYVNITSMEDAQECVCQEKS